MSEHRHTELVDGCYRCDLNRDEMAADAVEVACDRAWEQGRADVLVELHETQAQRDQARDLAARLEEELAQVRRQGIEWVLLLARGG